MGIISDCASNTPIVGQAIGFASTARKVYNATTPTGAVCAAVEGIAKDCTPPHIKYPLKCLILVGQMVVAGSSLSNPITAPLAIGLVIGQATSILEENII